MPRSGSVTVSAEMRTLDPVSAKLEGAPLATSRPLARMTTTEVAPLPARRRATKSWATGCSCSTPSRASRQSIMSVDQPLPVVTRRTLWAILKANTLFASVPDRVAGILVEEDSTEDEYTRPTLREIPHARERSTGEGHATGVPRPGGPTCAGRVANFPALNSKPKVSLFGFSPTGLVSAGRRRRGARIVGPLCGRRTETEATYVGILVTPRPCCSSRCPGASRNPWWRSQTPPTRKTQKPAIGDAHPVFLSEGPLRSFQELSTNFPETVKTTAVHSGDPAAVKAKRVRIPR